MSIHYLNKVCEDLHSYRWVVVKTEETGSIMMSRYVFSCVKNVLRRYTVLSIKRYKWDDLKHLDNKMVFLDEVWTEY